MMALTGGPNDSRRMVHARREARAEFDLKPAVARRRRGQANDRGGRPGLNQASQTIIWAALGRGDGLDLTRLGIAGGQGMTTVIEGQGKLCGGLSPLLGAR
jgi:hypothetical protein